MTNEEDTEMTNEAGEQRNALKDAVENCAKTVNRTTFSILAVASFCLLTTFGATDSSLLALGASINAWISFGGFLIVLEEMDLDPVAWEFVGIAPDLVAIKTSVKIKEVGEIEF